MLRQAIQTYLSTRTVEVGETVQCGWLVFRVLEVGPPVKLEGLDFVRMASFTADLSRAARHLFPISDPPTWESRKWVCSSDALALSVLIGNHLNTTAQARQWTGSMQRIVSFAFIVCSTFLCGACAVTQPALGLIKFV
jgi:hypothetical protein